MREETLAWIAARLVRLAEDALTAALLWIAVRRWLPVTMLEVLAGLLAVRALVRLARGQSAWLAVLLVVLFIWTSPAKAAVDNPRRLVPVRMTVTAYTAGPESTGKEVWHPEYGITASGKRVAIGTLAADPSIPFGTRIYVPSYGWGIVWDRGGAIKENRLDVYMPSLRDALRWGRKEVTVLVQQSGEEGAWGDDRTAMQRLQVLHQARDCQLVLRD